MRFIILYIVTVLVAVLSLMFLATLTFADSDQFYESMKGKQLGPVVSAKQCEEERFVIGLDENRNGLIDACYSLKYIDKQLMFKRVKIYYDIDDDKNLIDQGCVCD